MWAGNRDVMPWRNYIDAPGGLAMSHLKNLIESRMYTPLGQAIFEAHQPHQDLIYRVIGGANHENNVGTRGRVAGMSDRNGRYFMVYIPTNGSSRKVEVDLSHIAGSEARAWWFSPETGTASEIDTFEASGVRSFTTPGSGKDWVLVVDDASIGWGAPGR